MEREHNFTLLFPRARKIPLPPSAAALRQGTLPPWTSFVDLSADDVSCQSRCETRADRVRGRKSKINSTSCFSVQSTSKSRDRNQFSWTTLSKLREKHSIGDCQSVSRVQTHTRAIHNMGCCVVQKPIDIGTFGTPMNLYLLDSVFE